MADTVIPMPTLQCHMAAARINHCEPANVQGRVQRHPLGPTQLEEAAAISAVLLRLIEGVL